MVERRTAPGPGHSRDDVPTGVVGSPSSAGSGRSGVGTQDLRQTVRPNGVRKPSSTTPNDDQRIGCDLCGKPRCADIDVEVDGINKSVVLCADHYSRCVGTTYPKAGAAPTVRSAPASTRRESDLPDDEMAFRFMSGRRALDLTATVGERWRRNFERLRTPGDVDRWLIEAHLLQHEPAASMSNLHFYKVLREAVYRATRAVMAEVPVSRFDEDVLTTTAAHPPLAPIITHGQVSWTGEPAVMAAASTIARDAIDLLTNVDPGRLRECESAECALLFVDMSRPGNRRWCSTDTCGNRTRAKAYRLRRR